MKKRFRKVVKCGKEIKTKIDIFTCWTIVGLIMIFPWAYTFLKYDDNFLLWFYPFWVMFKVIYNIICYHKGREIYYEEL